LQDDAANDVALCHREVSGGGAQGVYEALMGNENRETVFCSSCQQVDKFLPPYWQDLATALANFCHRHGKVLPKVRQGVGKISL
jgi:hypothetical protein